MTATSWRDDPRIIPEIVVLLEQIGVMGATRSSIANLVITLLRRRFRDDEISDLLANFVWGKPLIADREGWDATLAECRGLSNTPIVTRDNWLSNCSQFTLLGGWTNLRRYRGSWYNWKNGAYVELEDATIKAAARDFLGMAMCRVPVKKKKGDTGPTNFELEHFRPFQKDVNELVHACEGYLHVAGDEFEPPAWINGRRGPPAHECIALSNGILHAPTLQVGPLTPDLFTFNVLPFAYDAAAMCPTWLKTLDQYWEPKADGSPADEVLLLQEIFAYLLLPWTDLQKIFIFLGAGRNGKGTIGRVLAALLGLPNVAAPTLSSLADAKYGREPLLGKLVAIVGESAFGGRDDRTAATSFLKSVSGEDVVEIGRKFKRAWIGRLPIRFLFLANVTPAFVDDSPAFAARAIALRFTKSFADAPDTTLSDRLATELPGILNWALQGYERLRESRTFTVPGSSVEAVADLTRLASPIGAFLDDCTVIDPADVKPDDRHVVTEDQLFVAFTRWCDANGAQRVRKGDFTEGVAVARPALVHKYRARLPDGKSRGPRSFRGLALIVDDRLNGIM